MKRWTTLTTTALLGLALALVPVPGWTQDKGKTVTSEQLKKMLDSLGRKYAVSADGDFILKVAKPGADKVTYRCIIYPYPKGQAIVITCNSIQRGEDTIRLKLAASNDDKAVDELLDRVNQWNVNMALSRAIVTKGMDKSKKKIHYARLEADLDWEIGVTDKKVDHLIKQFVKSLAEFETFLAGDKTTTDVRLDDRAR